MTIHCHEVSQQGIRSLKALNQEVQRAVPWSSDGGAVLKIKEEERTPSRAIGEDQSMECSRDLSRRPTPEKDLSFSSFSFFDLSFAFSTNDDSGTEAA